MFLSHLCFENFSETAMNSSGEVPAVHGLILPFLRAEVDQTYMNSMIGTMASILMCQISLLEAGNGAHTLLSPLILKLLYRFFAEFVSRFIESDESVYSAENWAILQQFNIVNGEFEISSYYPRIGYRVTFCNLVNVFVIIIQVIALIQ
jgi:hypothetical protein